MEDQNKSINIKAAKKSQDQDSKLSRTNGTTGGSTALVTSVRRATEALIADQNEDGHWRYNLECFVFSTAFHILTLYYIGEGLDIEMKTRFGNYLRRNQLTSGGWGFVPHGPMNINNSVTSYFALRLMGDQPEKEHMRQARKAILDNGGIEATDFLVRNYLGLFNIIPWSSVPSVPVEIMFLPDWFPFTIYKVAHWSRITIIPLTVLQAIQRPPKMPLTSGLDELFHGNPAQIGSIRQKSCKTNVFWLYLFQAVDIFLKMIIPLIPCKIRERAIEAAVSFCTQRLNGDDGFGSMSPPMHSVLMMFHVLGYAPDHPDLLISRKALRKLEVLQDNEAYISVVLSPVWDTALSICALLETEDPMAYSAAEKGLKWLRPLEIRDFNGDWVHQKPNLKGSSWAFFYKNPFYPDTDDTAAVVSGMYTMSTITSSDVDKKAIDSATNWILGMQSRNGGWASFEADNTHMYLNNIPLAGDNLLDPPTVDVTGGILLFLSKPGLRLCNSEPVRRGVEFILTEQERNGSWWGRWGVNYIYGTRLALCAITAVGLPQDHPSIKKGADWLISVQNKDGGWGESVEGYDEPRSYRSMPSTASQTSWALLGLMASCPLQHLAISLGVQYLLKKQNAIGQWKEDVYTGTGHPGVVHQKYNGYRKYFPLMALARYLRMVRAARGDVIVSFMHEKTSSED